MDPASAYKTLIPVLLYPHGGYHEQVERCCEVVKDAYPDVSECFEDFAKATEGLKDFELEELYVRTFDMTKDSSLDLGWQLFGEDYNRGLFLVKMRDCLRKYAIVETHELPDHLSHVLAVLAEMPEEEAFDFATACVIPAIKKSREGIEENNPYRRLTEGIVRLLESQYGQTMEESNHE